MLNERISKDEVETTLSQFQIKKELGRDEFLVWFTKKCWSVIGDEVVEALITRQKAGRFLKEINNTYLALIPKKENATKWEEFRPISLCNMISKLLAKVMANRL